MSLEKPDTASLFENLRKKIELYCNFDVGECHFTVNMVEIMWNDYVLVSFLLIRNVLEPKRPLPV